MHVLIMCVLGTKLNLRHLGEEAEWVAKYLAPYVNIKTWSGDVNLEDSVILVII